MKKRALVHFIMVLVIGFGVPFPTFAGVANDELLERLNQLTTTIQRQQEEIEALKKALQAQQRRTTRTEAAQKKEIQAAVKSETDKQAKSWRDQLPEWTRKNQAVRGPEASL